VWRSVKKLSPLSIHSFLQKHHVVQEYIIIIIIVYYATKAANIYTQLHVQEHNKKEKEKEKH